MAQIDGDLAVLDTPFPYTVYNKFLTNWRGAVAPTGALPGLVWSETVTEKLHHFGAGPADEEILQLTRSADVSPLFTTIKLSALTDGYLPYHVSDAAGLADGPMWTDATKIGLGTATVPHGGVGYAKFAIEGADGSAAGPHIQWTTAADDYPLLQFMIWTHDLININLDCYYDGGWKSSHAGSNFRIQKSGDILVFGYDSGNAQGAAITWNNGLILDIVGRVTIPTGFFNLGSADVTIDAGGEITATRSWMKVDTFAGAANDSLDTINGGTEGDVLILTAKDDGHTVTVTDDGNIDLDAGADMALNNIEDIIILILIGATWCEISRAT